MPDEGHLLWAHSPLVPGEYTMEVVSHNRVSLGGFKLAVTLQPAPHGLTGSRTSAPAVMPTPAASCWTAPHCAGARQTKAEAAPQIPAGPSREISPGGHMCALREERTPECWNYAGGPGGRVGRNQAPDEPLTTASTGWVHSGGLRPDGSAVC